MNYTPMNLIKHELVGLSAHVVESSDPGLVCRRGRIVDETKETIHLDTDVGVVMLPKNVCVFDIDLPQGTTVRVSGAILRGKPEDRIKKRHTRRW